MLVQNNLSSAVISDFFKRVGDARRLDKKARERLATERKMAARRAIERHYEARELEMAAKEYWFDG